MPSWTEEGELGRSTQKWTGRRKGLIESLPNGMSTDGSVGWCGSTAWRRRNTSRRRRSRPTNPHSLAAARYDDSVAANVEARWTQRPTNLITGTTPLSRSATLLPSLSATSRVAPPPRRRAPTSRATTRARGVRRQPSEGKERNPIGGIDTWATSAASERRSRRPACARARWHARGCRRRRGAGARRRAGGCARAARRCTRLAQQSGSTGERRPFFHGAVVRPAPPPKPPRRRHGPRRRPPSRSAARASRRERQPRVRQHRRPPVGQPTRACAASCGRYELWRETERGSWRSARRTCEGARPYR